MNDAQRKGDPNNVTDLYLHESAAPEIRTFVCEIGVSGYVKSAALKKAFQIQQ
jgi:hypothetical protein